MNDGRFMLTVGSYAYKRKPENWGTATSDLKKRDPSEISYREFMELVADGHTWVGACLERGKWGKNDNGFISQQVFGVDIDNATEVLDENGNKVKDENGNILKRALRPDEEGYLHPLDAIRRCVGLQEDIEPLFLYATFNSKPDWLRYRLVFLLDDPVTEWEDAEFVLRWLMGEFPECDKACKNPNRLYAGTTQGNVIPLRGQL